MADNSILDCQISASVDDGTNMAQDGRLDSNNGWATLDRGPPFYQHEYIQVKASCFIKPTSMPTFYKLNIYLGGLLDF